MHGRLAPADTYVEERIQAMWLGVAAALHLHQGACLALLPLSSQQLWASSGLPTLLHQR